MPAIKPHQSTRPKLGSGRRWIPRLGLGCGLAIAAAVALLVMTRPWRRPLGAAPVRIPAGGNETGPSSPLITGLLFLLKTKSSYEIDLTLSNPSGTAETVVIPPEFAIEGLPKMPVSGHPAEFELRPGQKGTYRWSIQVETLAIPTLRKTMADLMAGKKTLAIEARFRDSKGQSYVSRVSGRFQSGGFSVIAAKSPELVPDHD